MRIIAGKYRSRKLLSPKDDSTTRPIPDRVKESLFSMLRGNCEGAAVLDCFAGTGSIGLEALSRGAATVAFVERDKRAADLLERNIELLEAADVCTVIRADALGPAALARCPQPLDLAFFDPPYPVVLDRAGWERVSRQVQRVIAMLSDSGFAILRTPWPFRHVTVVDEQGHIVPHGDPRNPYDIRGLLRKDNPPPRGRGYIGRRQHIRAGDDEHDLDQEWIGDEIDIDEIESQTAELQAAPDAAPGEPGHGLRIHRADVDLALPGAVGPETHVYASTAVHLYMRKRD